MIIILKPLHLVLKGPPQSHEHKAQCWHGLRNFWVKRWLKVSHTHIHAERPTVLYGQRAKNQRIEFYRTQRKCQTNSWTARTVQEYTQSWLHQQNGLFLALPFHAGDQIPVLRGFQKLRVSQRKIGGLRNTCICTVSGIFRKFKFFFLSSLRMRHVALGLQDFPGCKRVAVVSVFISSTSNSFLKLSLNMAHACQLSFLPHHSFRRGHTIESVLSFCLFLLAFRR